MAVRSMPASAASGALRIRPAAPGDLDAVLAIERASFADPWSRPAFAQSLEGPAVRFDVAVAGDGLAGYVVAWFVADEGEVANLAVAPAHRRGGVAAALLDGVLADARARGVRSVFLEVRESNAAARALYARFGFREGGRRSAYYRKPVEDALILVCELPPLQ